MHCVLVVVAAVAINSTCSHISSGYIRCALCSSLDVLTDRTHVCQKRETRVRHRADTRAVTVFIHLALVCVGVLRHISILRRDAESKVLYAACLLVLV
jgi:hypothetical protein